MSNIIETKVIDLQSKQFLHYPKPKAILIDFHNQFGLSANGKTIEYLNAERVNFVYGDGTRATLKLDGVIDKIREFIYATKYGYEHRADVERR